MKKFDVEQQYANIADMRKNKKLVKPFVIGTFEAHTPYDAVKQASHESTIPALLLHPKKVQ
jgi:hypothetical protein